MNSWHTASDASSVAIFLFRDIRAREGEYITGNTRVCETRSVLTTVAAFSAIAFSAP